MHALEIRCDSGLTAGMYYSHVDTFVKTEKGTLASESNGRRKEAVEERTYTPKAVHTLQPRGHSAYTHVHAVPGNTKTLEGLLSIILTTPLCTLPLSAALFLATFLSHYPSFF